MLLGEAIDRNLLSTFQYFCITDEVDYRKLKWTRGSRYDISGLDEIWGRRYGDGPFVSVPLFTNEQGDRNKRTVPIFLE